MRSSAVLLDETEDTPRLSEVEPDRNRSSPVGSGTGHPEWTRANITSQSNNGDFRSKLRNFHFPGAWQGAHTWSTSTRTAPNKSSGAWVEAQRPWQRVPAVALEVARIVAEAGEYRESGLPAVAVLVARLVAETGDHRDSGLNRHNNLPRPLKIPMHAPTLSC